MLQLHVKGRPTDPYLDFSDLARRTEGYVSSDLKFLVNEAARLALKSRVQIQAAHFDEVLAIHKPSISREQIRAYERFAEQRTFTD